ncbi:MAG: hypothetical protein Q8N99_07400 [Nanoarchaeota archaeon]|nr:hypothetical protein [Nanoarchaeota archaeon]
MQEIYIEDIGRILKSKRRLEKELNVKLYNQGRLMFIEGKSEDEYLALKIIEAMNLGFSINKALLLKDVENIFQIINIKDITKRHDLERVRARIIGTHGKTIANLSKLSECELSLKENQVGIIGNSDRINESIISLESLIRGSKQGNVYTRLEKKGKERRNNPKFKTRIINDFKKLE